MGNRTLMSGYSESGDLTVMRRSVHVCCWCRVVHCEVMCLCNTKLFHAAEDFLDSALDTPSK